MSIALEHDELIKPTKDRRATARRVTFALFLLLCIVSAISLSIGASEASLRATISDLISGREVSDLNRIVLWDIRLPRLAMGMLVGAALAVSGVVMQGLFRNPLADPGIVGVSAGAGLGAISAIILGSYLPAAILSVVGNGLVAVAAFLGGWASVLILYRVSTRRGQTSVATMLLAGIGIIASIVGGFFIQAKEGATQEDLLKALRRGVLVSAGLVIVFSLLAVFAVFSIDYLGIWAAMVVGLIAGIIVGTSSEIYTSSGYKPTQEVAETALTGSATLIISGTALGMPAPMRT